MSGLSERVRQFQFEISLRLAILSDSIKTHSESLYDGKRFLPVDIARGLCLTWMCFAHVLSATGAEGLGWARYFYLAGWSTTDFVMLTGLTLALLGKAPSGKTINRGVKLLVVAYLTNFLFTSLKAFALHEMTASRVVEIVTLRAPWTISAVLLPSVFLLFSLGRWEEMLANLEAPLFMGVVTVLELLGLQGLTVLPSSVANHTIVAALTRFDNPWFGFPMLILFGLGVWAFAFGSLFRHQDSKSRIVFAVISIAVLVLVPIKNPLLLYVSRFGATLLFGVVIASIPGLTRVSSVLMLLGRSSLLVFVFHRIVIQVGSRVVMGLPLAYRSTSLFLATLVLSGFACLAKERIPRLGDPLRRLGF